MNAPYPMHQPTLDYEVRDIASIRKGCPELASRTDGEIAALWEWFSGEFWVAGWLNYAAYPDGAGFRGKLGQLTPDALQQVLKESPRRDYGDAP